MSTSANGGVRCSYRNCSNRSSNECELSFFKFPVKHKERCLQWIQNCGREDLIDLPETLLQHRAVCSEHFKSDAFTNCRRNKLLKNYVNAVPIAKAVPVPWCQVQTENNICYSTNGDHSCQNESTNNDRRVEQDEGDHGGNGQADGENYIATSLLSAGGELMERPGGVMEDTLDMFGRYVSSILRQIPVPESFELQKKFINEAITAKLAYERVCPSSPPHQKRKEISKAVNTTKEPTPKPTPSTSSVQKKNNMAATSLAEDRSATPIEIKEEPMDDCDDTTQRSDDESEMTLSMVAAETQGNSQDPLEEDPQLNAVKDEMESSIEVVLCDSPCNQLNPVESTASERLEVPLDGGNIDTFSLSQEKRLFTCSRCSKFFVRSEDLKNHFKDSHPGSQSRDVPSATKLREPNLPTPSKTLLSPDSQANSSSASICDTQSLSGCSPSITQTPIWVPSVRVNQMISPSVASASNIGAVARYHAQINDRLRLIETVQTEILEKFDIANQSINTPIVPLDITLPCSSVQEVEELDLWLKNEDNVSTLTKHLSLVGGKKVPNVTRRILERLFTNSVAALYNWTGKNQKHSLKDLEVIKRLPDLVRCNKNMQVASDDEVHKVTSQWFRFTKDREGGREKRRKMQPSEVNFGH